MSNQMAKRPRPLSPNIQIYRPQLTSVLSIVNRITGVAFERLCRRAGCLADCGGNRTPRLCRGARRYRVLDRSDRAVRGHLCLFPAPLRWHPASRVGHGPRIRTPVDIRLGMGGCGGERGAHSGSLAHQLIVQDSADGSSTHALAPRLAPWASARQRRGSNTGGWSAYRPSRSCPLTLWFVASIIAHTGSDYATFIAWLRAPLATIS